MKYFILIIVALISLNGKAQHGCPCINDTIIHVWPDSLNVGDTLHVAVYYSGQLGGDYGSDSVVLNMQYYSSDFYLQDQTNMKWGVNTYGNDTNKIVIPFNVTFTTSYTKVFLYTIETATGNPSINTPKAAVYIRNKPLGIDELSGTHTHIIREVRYYTITGQLYGTFAQKQNNLPSIPLIEEVIYTDNYSSTRTLLRIK